MRALLLPLVDIPPSATDDAQFGGQACKADSNDKRYRPDLLYGDRRLVIDVEVDEDGGHPQENPECQVSRMSTLTAIFQKENMFGADTCVYFIRFNPDPFLTCDQRQEVTLDERVNVLAARINELRVNPPVAGGVPLVEYLFYRDSCLKHAEYARQHPDSIQVVRVGP